MPLGIFYGEVNVDMKIKSYEKIITYLLALFILSISMFMLPFSKIIFICIFVVLSIVGIFIKKKNFLLFSASILITLLILQVVAYLLNTEKKTYYRPLEKLSQIDKNLNLVNLKPNTELLMDKSYGDLYAMTGNNDDIITPEIKTLFYKTDKLGFRNYMDYIDQQYTLIGDSFIIGPNLTQNILLNYQLKEKYDLDTYNFSHINDIYGYVKYIKTFEKTTKNNNWKAIVFLFEGNDFNIQKPKTVSSFYSFVSIFRELPLYKIVYSIGSRAVFNLTNKVDSGNFPVYSYTINNQKIGFLRQYIQASTEETFFDKDFLNPLLSVKDRIELIVYIPTKYRVYYDYLNESEGGKLANSKWEYLKEFCVQNNFNCTNLTMPLKKLSNTLMLNNLFTYDKDDTHWNKYGVSVAADVIYNELKKLTIND